MWSNKKYRNNNIMAKFLLLTKFSVTSYTISWGSVVGLKMFKAYRYFADCAHIAGSVFLKHKYNESMEVYQWCFIV